MARPEKLEIRTWWSTLGDWGPTEAALKRFDKGVGPHLRQQANGLVNRLVRNNPNFEVKNFLQRTLPLVAEHLSAAQFSEALDLAERMLNDGIDPSLMLQSGLPALAQNCRTADAFKTNLLYLEALVHHLNDHGIECGKSFFVAVRTVAKDLDKRQLTSSLVLATRLAEAGSDPTEVLRISIPAAVNGLTNQQFRLALSEASHVARRRGDVAALLGRDLPGVAREVSPDQLTTALRLAVHLEEKHIPFDRFFRGGLPPLVDASATPDDFNRNLQAVGTLLVRLREKDIDLDIPLSAAASGCEMPDDFRHNIEALYRFAVTMQKNNVQPKEVLRSGFPPTVAHTPESFQTTLQNLITIVVRLREAGIDDHLMSYIIEYGLDRVAKSSTTAEDYRGHLVTLMKSFRHLAIRPMAADAHEKALTSIKASPIGFVNATDGMTPQTMLSGGLSLVYELAASHHFDWTAVATRHVTALAGEAIPLINAGTQYSIGVSPPPRLPIIVKQVEGAAAFRSRARTSGGNSNNRETSSAAKPAAEH